MEFILLFAICMIVLSIAAQSKKKKILKDLKENSGSNHVERLTHAYGLNLPAQTQITAYLKNDTIDFEANGTTFTLQKSKLLDVSSLTDVQVQSQYTSSIGGAVAGAVLLGPIGAVIGGRSKQKNSKTRRQFLIFTYASDDQHRYLSFDITSKPLSGIKFIKDFKEHGGTKVSYNL